MSHGLKSQRLCFPIQSWCWCFSLEEQAVCLLFQLHCWTSSGVEAVTRKRRKTRKKKWAFCLQTRITFYQKRKKKRYFQPKLKPYNNTNLMSAQRILLKLQIISVNKTIFKCSSYYHKKLLSGHSQPHGAEVWGEGGEEEH